MTLLFSRRFAWLALAGMVAGCQHAPVALVDAQAPAYAVPSAPASPTRAALSEPAARSEPAAPVAAGAAATGVTPPSLQAGPRTDATVTPTLPAPVEWSPTWGTPEIGIASWYGPRFHGRRTANGEKFDMTDFSAAHRLLPLGSYARVRNPNNGRLVLVRINDRGPFTKGRIIDLSHAAAAHLGVTERPQKVEVYALATEAVRSTPPPTKARPAPVRKTTRRQVRTL